MTASEEDHVTSSGRWEEIQDAALSPSRDPEPESEPELDAELDAELGPELELDCDEDSCTPMRYLGGIALVVLVCAYLRTRR